MNYKKVVPRKGRQINKKGNKFLEIGHLFSKLVTFFGVRMMGTTGTTRGVRMYPTIP